MSSEGCKCGSNCNCSGCSCEMDVQKSTPVATIEGVAPVNMHSEGSEKSFGAEGCKCGSSCTCNPCNC